MSPSVTDVLIAGAGPTGLLLAGDLAAAGVAVTILERRDYESNLTRAFAVHARTLEMLDARGVADRLIATGRRVASVRVFGNVKIDLSRLPSRYPYLLITPQYETEKALEERAEALGVRIIRGTEVVGLRQHADGVDVDGRAEEGATHTWRAAYVVGADGVHSTVRKALGLPFPGRSAVRSVMMADVRLTEEPANVLTINGAREGFAFIVPFGDGWYRVIAWDRARQLPDDAPVELGEIQAITRTVLGTDHGMHDARWLSRFHSDERQTPRYRVGRVFLAGDAAHAHSPAGGQGMNTGLQDAANLGWKLVAAVRGWAPDGLLDSYQAERHPVGHQVVRGSGALLRLALLRPWALRTLRDVLVGGALRIRPLARLLADRLSGIGIRYPAPRGAHRLVGTRAPDLPLVTADGGATRLYQALRSGRFVLVTSQDAPADWADRVDIVTPAAAGSATMLVRPDGYIARASDDTDLTRQVGVLAEWLGEPAAGRPSSATA